MTPFIPSIQIEAPDVASATSLKILITYFLSPGILATNIVITRPKQFSFLYFKGLDHLERYVAFVLKHHDKAYGGVQLQIPVFLTS